MAVGDGGRSRSERVVSAATTVLEVGALASIVYGVYLIWIPAAFIVGGVAALVLAWRLTR